MVKAVLANGRLRKAFGNAKKGTKWVLWSAEYTKKDAKKVMAGHKGKIIRGLGSSDKRDIRYGVYKNYSKKR